MPVYRNAHYRVFDFLNLTVFRQYSIKKTNKNKTRRFKIQLFLFENDSSEEEMRISTSTSSLKKYGDDIVFDLFSTNVRIFIDIDV